jgi:hypothetical protein
LLLLLLGLQPSRIKMQQGRKQVDSLLLSMLEDHILYLNYSLNCKLKCPSSKQAAPSMLLKVLALLHPTANGLRSSRAF